jgi:hypothetical protein
MHGYVVPHLFEHLAHDRFRQWPALPLSGEYISAVPNAGAVLKADKRDGVVALHFHPRMWHDPQLTVNFRPAPKIVRAGGKPTAFQRVNQCTALRSIGAVKVRREGRQRVWRLPDECMEKPS